MATSHNPQATDGHLVLAGGGHSHALLLKRWAMQPNCRPSGLITLVNRHSTTLYSGMVPGFIAGLYRREELAIDLRRLADQAGVAFVLAEITGLDLHLRELQLDGRPSLRFDRLSLNLGSVTAVGRASKPPGNVAIKPLEPAVEALEHADALSRHTAPFELMGSGLAAIELAFALRHRWPVRPLRLQARSAKLAKRLQQAIAEAGIALLHPEAASTPQLRPALHCTSLHCTGSSGPTWLAASGLPVDAQGRVRTSATLEVLGHPGLFAAGDCGVIDHDRRPPSGVWAVRAAPHLAHNLEASGLGRPLRPWAPQRRALQLLGGFQDNGQPTAWALWGPLLIGPHPWLWRWKRAIDRRFMARFQPRRMPGAGKTKEQTMLCRGCAAKLPAAPLEAALEQAGLKALGSAPEDAAPLPNACTSNGQAVLQSVDGFPALISDPWLNGRLTALHACSDLWACGARVDSAQAIVTLPLTAPSLQQELLRQTLEGVRSVLEPQGAQLIGGHTLEARSRPESPLSLGSQLVLSVQGAPTGAPWPKRGIQAGDQLLLSRPLGTGVLFAAAMALATPPDALDQALDQMGRSQHHLVEQLRSLEQQHPGQLHAATDITGFGLLGHLGEMLGDTSDAPKPLQIHLEARGIPALPGALELLAAGHASSLAPANRRAWSLLDSHPALSTKVPVRLSLSKEALGSKEHQALLELLVDPQTCGPLMISVTPTLAEALRQQTPQSWHNIGEAMEMNAD